jgi:hypothetical protein
LYGNGGKMKKTTIFFVSLAMMTLFFSVPAFADWMINAIPTVPYGAAGEDGIFGTWDDPVPLPGEIFFLGMVSGYTGFLDRDAGRYPGEQGSRVTVNSDLRTEIFQINANTFRYVWTLSNRGSADMIAYFDTNGPWWPNFITVKNNFGTIELDGSANAPFDLSTAPRSEVQTVVGGPPIPLQWGGQWNPESGTEAESRQPSSVPEPTVLVLLSLGLIGLGCHENQWKG